jgi:hypothetical protein
MVNVFISWNVQSWNFSHGDFLTIIELPEGEHQYKFFVDGAWQTNPSEVRVFVCDWHSSIYIYIYWPIWKDKKVMVRTSFAEKKQNGRKNQTNTICLPSFEGET